MAIKVHKDMVNADDYSWVALEPDNPKDVKHDAVMFNRKEGYEVILMLQKICNHFDYDSPADVKRVAGIIKNDLPGNIRSQENVYNWLVENAGPQ